MRDVKQIVLDICDYLDPAGWYPRPEVAVLSQEYTQYADGQYSYTRNTVCYCPRLADDRLWHVLAHETRHWWQFHVGWLDTQSGEVWWQGWRCMSVGEVQMLVAWGNGAAYNCLPWERDAEDFANEYMGHLAKTLAA